MKRSKVLLLMAAFTLFTFSALAQKDADAKQKDAGVKWTRIYTEEGRRLDVPDTWKTEESVRNGVRQVIVENPNQTVYMAMFFFEGSATAGERMQMMVSHNNIDILESSTETFGSLKVMSKKGKMTYNKQKFKVLLTTADGAGGRWNVVGAIWGPDEAFQKHKDKFEIFFTSLD